MYRALQDRCRRGSKSLYPLAGRPPAGEPILRRSRRCAMTRRCWSACKRCRLTTTPASCTSARRSGAASRSTCRNTTRRPRMAAGDGAARRQRQRPRLPVELAARRPQPRRDPGRADRHRQHLGADGRRHRHAEPDAHSGSRAVALERRSGPDAADRDERRRHVLLRDGVRWRFAFHPPRAGRRRRFIR